MSTRTEKELFIELKRRSNIFLIDMAMNHEPKSKLKKFTDFGDEIDIY